MDTLKRILAATVSAFALMVAAVVLGWIIGWFMGYGYKFPAAVIFTVGMTAIIGNEPLIRTAMDTIKNTLRRVGEGVLGLVVVVLVRVIVGFFFDIPMSDSAQAWKGLGGLVGILYEGNGSLANFRGVALDVLTFISVLMVVIGLYMDKSFARRGVAVLVGGVVLVLAIAIVAPGAAEFIPGRETFDNFVENRLARHELKREERLEDIEQIERKGDATVHTDRYDAMYARLNFLTEQMVTGKVLSGSPQDVERRKLIHLLRQHTVTSANAFRVSPTEPLNPVPGMFACSGDTLILSGVSGEVSWCTAEKENKETGTRSRSDGISDRISNLLQRGEYNTFATLTVVLLALVLILIFGLWKGSGVGQLVWSGVGVIGLLVFFISTSDVGHPCVVGPDGDARLRVQNTVAVSKYGYTPLPGMGDYRVGGLVIGILPEDKLPHPENVLWSWGGEPPRAGRRIMFGNGNDGGETCGQVVMAINEVIKPSGSPRNGVQAFEQNGRDGFSVKLIKLERPPVDERPSGGALTRGTAEIVEHWDVHVPDSEVHED